LAFYLFNRNGHQKNQNSLNFFIRNARLAIDKLMRITNQHLNMLIISKKGRVWRKKEDPEIEPSPSCELQTHEKQKLIKNINRTRRDLQMSPCSFGC